MAQGYTPGLTITDSAVIRKRRQLPLPGRVLVEVGQQVAAQDVIAATELPGPVTPLNIAHELNIQPGDVPRAMVVAERERVESGQLLAETRALWGLFHAVARAPVSGTVESISAVSGQVLLRGEPLPVEVRAYLSGTIVEVEPDVGATVECVGAFLQGIIGLGREAFGTLRVAVDGPDAALGAEAIDERFAGAVIVGGSLVTYDALEAAMAVGAAGVVCGGISDSDVDRFLGYTLGVAITGQEDTPLTVVITEGFGQIAMSDRAFSLLAANEGRQASINGATQIRAGVIRPEVVIPKQATAQVIPEPPEQTGLAIGRPIRLIRDPYFGLLGTIAELPEAPQQIETEAMVRVLVARLQDGRLVTVPRANVELIQT